MRGFRNINIYNYKYLYNKDYGSVTDETVKAPINDDKIKQNDTIIPFKIILGP